MTFGTFDQTDFWKIVRFLEYVQIFWKIFRFSENFQIFRKSLNFRKIIMTFMTIVNIIDKVINVHNKKTITAAKTTLGLVTFHTHYNSDN